VEHEGKGKLTTTEFSELKKSLNVSETDTKNIVIHYYQGLDACNQHADKNQFVIDDIRTYNRKFKKSNSNLYFVYKETKGLKNRLDMTTWIDDTSGAIENLFLRWNIPAILQLLFFRTEIISSLEENIIGKKCLILQQKIILYRH